MCAATPYAAKPSINTRNREILFRNCTRTFAGFQVTMAALNRSESINLPVLSVQEMPRIYERIHDIVQRQSQSNSLAMNNGACRKQHFDPIVLEEAYERCRNIFAENSKTFYLGSQLLTKQRQRAISAIYAWCKRMDDLVDGPSAVNMSCGVVDEWEDRLEDIFSGRPHDLLDAALDDTISKFSLDIMPFKDLLEGMRMDVNKNRYANFEELCLYCYNVAGACRLMSLPVLGIAQESPFPAEKICSTTFYLGISSQLTNILRDVGEDASRGRVYLPQDELAQFGLSNKDIFSRKITHNWREFMKEQIKRTKFYYGLVAEGASQYDKTSRWAIWSSLVMYRMILDEIEQNDYNNLTKRAEVGRLKKLLTLPFTYVRALSVPSFASHI